MSSNRLEKSLIV